MQLEDLEFGDLPHLATKKSLIQHHLGTTWRKFGCVAECKKNILCLRPVLFKSLAFGHVPFHLSQILVVARKKLPEAYLPMTSSRAMRKAARLRTSKSEPARFAH